MWTCGHGEGWRGWEGISWMISQVSSNRCPVWFVRKQTLVWRSRRSQVLQNWKCVRVTQRWDCGCKARKNVSCTKPRKCHYAVTEGRWFPRVVLFWKKFVNNIVQLQKKCFGHIVFSFVGSKLSGTKIASHWTGNFVDEVGHFNVPLWQSSAVVCRQCDLDLLWTQTHNSVTAFSGLSIQACRHERQFDRRFASLRRCFSGYTFCQFQTLRTGCGLVFSVAWL